jgi:non-specific serine/threonine protein kinase
MYFLLHGRPPTPATARVAQGEGPLLNAADHPQVSPAFVAAVEWALAVRPGDRPQDVAALREALDGRIAPVLPQGSLRSGAADAEATVILPAGGTPYANTRPVTRTEPVAPPAMARASVASGPSMASGASASTGATAARPEAPARKPLAALALGAVLFVAAGAGWWATHRSSGSADGAAVPASAPTAAAAASAAPAAAETPPAPAALARSPEARPVVTPPSDTHRAPIVTAVPTPSQTAQPSERRAAAPVSVAPRASAAHTARAAEPPPRNDTPQPPPTAAAEPTAPAATGPATPREACGKRVLLALAHCMEQQCTTPRFQSHPQCVRVRELMEDRRRRIEMGGSD